MRIPYNSKNDAVGYSSVFILIFWGWSSAMMLNTSVIWTGWKTLANDKELAVPLSRSSLFHAKMLSKRSNHWILKKKIYPLPTTFSLNFSMLGWFGASFFDFESLFCLCYVKSFLFDQNQTMLFFLKKNCSVFFSSATLLRKLLYGLCQVLLSLQLFSWQ